MLRWCLLPLQPIFDTMHALCALVAVPTKRDAIIQDGKDEKGNPIVEAAKEVVGAGEGKKPKSPNSTASEADDPGPRKAMKDALVDMQDKMDGKK